MNDLYDDWRMLCNEYHSIWNAHMKSFNKVNSKYIEVGKGISNNGPSDDELDEYEKTWDAIVTIKRRMEEFVKTNTSKS